MEKIFITEVPEIVLKDRYPHLWGLDIIREVDVDKHFYIWVDSIHDINTIYCLLHLIPSVVWLQLEDITETPFRVEYNYESNMEFIEDFKYHCHMKAIELEKNNQLIGAYCK